MRTGVDDQLRQLTAALVTGGVIGLLFDLLRARGAVGKALRLLCTTAAGALVFAVGRASGTGLRLFFLLASAGGMCLYLWALHPMICDDLTVAKQYLQKYAGKMYKNAVGNVKK